MKNYIEIVDMRKNYKNHNMVYVYHNQLDIICDMHTDMYFIYMERKKDFQGIGSCPIYLSVCLSIYPSIHLTYGSVSLKPSNMPDLYSFAHPNAH